MRDFPFRRCILIGTDGSTDHGQVLDEWSRRSETDSHPRRRSDHPRPISHFSANTLERLSTL